MPAKTVSLKRFEPTRCPTCGLPQPKDPLPPAGADEAVDAYRRLRARLAREEGVPPWRVWPNAAVRALAEARPTKGADLEAVPGLGPVRVEKYGRALLAVARKLKA